MNHQLEKWDPIKEFNQLGNKLQSFFSKNNPTLSGELFDSKLTEWNPAVDISEDDDEFLVTADLPEVKKDEVQLSIDKGVLSISGERKSETEKKDKKKKYHRVERSYGSYQRTFRLPDNVNEEHVKAEFNDGVLRIHLPKDGQHQQKTIKIT